MSIRLALQLLTLVAIVGCTHTPGPPQTKYAYLAASFDSRGAAQMIEGGQNTVKGNAFMRQQGGGVVTCAGEEVTMIPATAYAQLRMQYVYGNTKSGVVKYMPNVEFFPNPDEYQNLTRRTRCDSQGNFLFERVADGDFYFVTSVNWQAGNTSQGGFIMLRSDVKGSATVSLVLSP